MENDELEQTAKHGGSSLDGGLAENLNEQD